MTEWSYRCPLCDRCFMNDGTRRQHLAFSKRWDAVEAILQLRFRLADANFLLGKLDETVAAARRQRDEARSERRLFTGITGK